MAKKIDKRLANLSDPDRKVRRRAAHRLCRQPRIEDSEVWRTALYDPDYYVRTNAAQALGMMGDPANIDLLISVLNDRTKTVRKAAIAALARFAEERAIESIFLLLLERRKMRRQTAREALIEAGPAAAPLMCKALLRDNPELQNAVAYCSFKYWNCRYDAADVPGVPGFY